MTHERTSKETVVSPRDVLVVHKLRRTMRNTVLAPESWKFRHVRGASTRGPAAPLKGSEIGAGALEPMSAILLLLAQYV